MFKKKKDQTYQSYWSISWNIFKKNKVAMVCLFIVILLCLIALFAPLIAPYDPNKQVLNRSFNETLRTTLVWYR